MIEKDVEYLSSIPRTMWKDPELAPFHKILRCFVSREDGTSYEVNGMRTLKGWFGDEEFYEGNVTVLGWM